MTLLCVRIIEEGISRLRQALSIFRTHNLILRLEKCSFFAEIYRIFKSRGQWVKCTDDSMTKLRHSTTRRADANLQIVAWGRWASRRWEKRWSVLSVIIGLEVWDKIHKYVCFELYCKHTTGRRQCKLNFVEKISISFYTTYVSHVGPFETSRKLMSFFLY